jgi:hypothetical protein
MSIQAARRLLPILAHLRTGTDEYDYLGNIDIQYTNAEDDGHYSGKLLRIE